MVHNGVPKLHDFGISHILNDALGFSTRVHGSDLYSAPEVMKARSGSSVKISPGADIFSFGRVLYEVRIPELYLKHQLSDHSVFPRKYHMRARTTVTSKG